MRNHHIARSLLLGLILIGTIGARAAEPRPITRFAIVSTPYITAKDRTELDPSRQSIVPGAEKGVPELLAALKQHQDVEFLLILGDLTWQGSDADYEKLDEMFLSKLDRPFHLVPMSLKPDDNPGDLSDGGKTFLERFGKKYGAKLRGSIRHKGVYIAYNGPTLDNPDKQQAYVDWLRQDLASAGDVKAALLAGETPLRFGSRVNQNTEGKTAWSLIDQHDVAGVIEATRYPPKSDLYNGLPFWHAAPMTWSGSPDYDVTLVSVFEDRIEVDYINLGQPTITLRVPNPKAADRLNAEKDPYGLPTYTQDLARKPELTFVLLGDPQLDDQKRPKLNARYVHAVEMSRALVPNINRLKPDFALIAGDCTNTNTLEEWKLFREIFGSLEMPVYPVPGNHDVGATPDVLSGKVDAGEATEVKRESAAFAKKIEAEGFKGPNALFQYFTRDMANKGQPNYVFEAQGGATFICMDNSLLNDPLIPEAGFVGYGDGQLRWLEEQLQAARESKHVFVVAHFPINPQFGGTGEPRYESQRVRVMELCEKHNAVAFLSGHRHKTMHAATGDLLHVVANAFCWGEHSDYWIVHVFEDEIVFALRPFDAPRHQTPNALYTRITFPEARAK